MASSATVKLMDDADGMGSLNYHRQGHRYYKDRFRVMRLVAFSAVALSILFPAAIFGYLTLGSELTGETDAKVELARSQRDNSVLRTQVSQLVEKVYPALTPFEPDKLVALGGQQVKAIRFADQRRMEMVVENNADQPLELAVSIKLLDFAANEIFEGPVRFKDRSLIELIAPHSVRTITGAIDAPTGQHAAFFEMAFELN